MEIFFAGFPIPVEILLKVAQEEVAALSAEDAQIAYATFKEMLG